MAFGGVSQALAASYTWTGSAGPATWNQAANWGGVTPSFNNQADAFFNAASAGNLSNLLNNTDKTVRSLNFTSAVPRECDRGFRPSNEAGRMTDLTKPF